MRLESRWLLSLVLATSTFGVANVQAQPATRDHRKVPPTAPNAHADNGPTEAPPSPREEKVAAKAGFVWIGGRWDWRGKWEWVAGHWERERAGKEWRPGKWDKKDNKWVYVDGAWFDAGAPPPPTTLPAPAGGPTSPPPPPRAESPGTKAGFVWVEGQWDWKDNKWDWVAGHWERERAGKKWRASRWEQRDGKWSRVDGDWEDAGAPGPGNGPTSAPPPPRPESPGAKAGFVWVEGQWDWKDNKWDWVAGHWERERAGKKWRASRWEQRDGKWSRVDGDWEDANAPGLPPNGNPGPLPPHLPPRHEWKLERPVVSSYWPIKGKAGTKVVIRGKNFPKDASVVFAGQQVNGAKVTADTITFAIPATGATGAISLRAGGRRELAVGNFEVAAAFDPIAEAKRLEAERQKAAQAAWTARQAQLAKDRAAREAAMQQRQQERESTRDRRRAERIAEIAAKWQRAFLADADTQDELTLHAQRIADIERMRDLADLTANAKLAVRIEVALSRENERHDQRMVALEASFKTRGGTP